MKSPISGDEHAFPISASTGDPRDGVYCQSGLTIRAHFAALAMQGILASGDIDLFNASFEGCALAATKAADALIAELNKAV